jgi:thiol:disulfide interchange protein DsbD
MEEGPFGRLPVSGPATPTLPAPFSTAVRLLTPGQSTRGSAVAEVNFSCKPDYYVRFDSIQFMLADTGGAGAGIMAGRLALPEPKEKYDKYAEDTVRYLEGHFTGTRDIRISPGVPPGRYDLTFDIRYTGCGPDICQFVTDHATVPLTVLPAGPALQGATPALAEGGQRYPMMGRPAESGSPGRPRPGETEGAAWFAGRGLLGAVLLAFIGGLGLTLTPCVYPLIPVTVSLIGATATGRKLDAFVRAVVYVFGIAVTYSVVGVVAAATGGVFGAWLQHPSVYLLLAALFVLLAGAMFDLYRINVTSQRLQRLQAGLRGRWGLVGIWVIGLLSGAAATACIAPVIIGVIGYVVQSRNTLLGWLIFFAMAWGMGAPLVVLGTFAGLLRSLPKSGQWMVTVKQVFGFALVAVAVYFVGKSRIMPQAWFRGLVGAFLLASAVFVGGFDALTLESGWWARARKAAGLLLIAGAVWAFVSAAVPAVLPTAAPTEAGQGAGVQWVGSEPEAAVRAQAEGKPLLLFFSADWCGPCHRMLRTTFVDPQVVAELRRLVCARVDVTNWSDEAVTQVRQKYGVYGAPTVVLAGTNGSIESRAGYLDAGDLLPLLRSVR